MNVSHDQDATTDAAERLRAEVSSSVLTPLRYRERSAHVWQNQLAVLSRRRAWSR